jgi:hypothetical protein
MDNIRTVPNTQIALILRNVELRLKELELTVRTLRKCIEDDSIEEVETPPVSFIQTEEPECLE